jgi:hypothetical protein
MRLGESDFERQFTIESSDESVARGLLTGGVRAALVMLARIRTGPIVVTFERAQLVVQKLATLDKSAELSAFVRHTMELYDQAVLSRSTGIEFVEQMSLQSIDDAKCPVCCDVIEDDLVFCGRCKSPHHRECWHYSGKCATYGCGETQYVIPRVAKPQ